MTSQDEQYELPEDAREDMFAAKGGPTWAHAARFMRRITVLLLAGLVVTACSGTSNDASKSTTPSPSGPVAEVPSGGSLQSSDAKPTPGVGAHPIKVKGHVSMVLNNGKVSVCSLISSKQVDHIMGRNLPRPRALAVGTFDECTTTQRHAISSRGAPLNVAWAVPPESQPATIFKHMTISLPQSDALRGLGNKAYCSSSKDPAASQLFIIDGRTILEVFADTCGHAIALAQVALSRL